MSQMIESFMNDDAASPGKVQPIAFEELQSADGGAPLAVQRHPLHALKVQLEAHLGTASMTVGELLGARESAVLALDRFLDQPVDLVLEGRVVARGELVAVDDRFAVRLTELPLPLQF